MSRFQIVGCLFILIGSSMGRRVPCGLTRQLAWARFSLKPQAAALLPKRHLSEARLRPPSAAWALRASRRNKDLYDGIIIEHSRRNGLDPRLVKSIIVVESQFSSQCVSPSGAIGLMQLMPATGEEMGVPRDALRDPEANIRAGTTYLRTLFRQAWKRSGLEGMDYAAAPLAVRRRIIAAYHGGPRMLALVAWPEVTRDYVANVLLSAGAKPTALHLPPPPEAQSVASKTLPRRLLSPGPELGWRGPPEEAPAYLASASSQ
jgi:soluble lytic murein transglycosylase-like protein